MVEQPPTIENSDIKEVKVTAPPMFHLIMAGISALLQFMNEQEEKTPIPPEQIFTSFAEGVRMAVPKVGYGLHALAPKQEKFLAVLERAQQDILAAGKENEIELKLIAVPKRVEGGLVDVNGQPLTKEPKLVLVK